MNVFNTCEITVFKSVLSDNNLWVFDKNDFKDAMTFLILNDERETNENDLELKKLIAMQFSNNSDMILWAVDLFEKVILISFLLILKKKRHKIYVKEFENKPKRVSKQPIFISIATEKPDVNKLSGKYIFHSLKNNAAVFVRDGPKIETVASPYPYYLAYNNKFWNLQDADFFEEREGNGLGGGWLALRTKGFRLKFSHNFNIVLRN